MVLLTGKPDFSFEKMYILKGYTAVIGTDEVGRGAFAGPVVAGAAVLKIIFSDGLYPGGPVTRQPQNNPYKGTRFGSPRLVPPMHSLFFRSPSSPAGRSFIEDILKLGINDSKKLSPAKREKLDKEIRKYFYCGIGETSVAVINKLGIVKATERAMRQAIKNVLLQLKAGERKIYLLIDAFNLKNVDGIGLKNQKGIVKGDEKSISIAAASIIAKVYRDNLMRKLSGKYKKYKWSENKGYGTDFHRSQIVKYGVTKLHRAQFVESWLENGGS